MLAVSIVFMNKNKLLLKFLAVQNSPGLSEYLQYTPCT